MDSEPKNKYRKGNHCPYCNHYCDAATLPEDEEAAPYVGALSVCIECAKVSAFDKDMKLERFDMNTLDQDEHAFVTKMQYAIHGVRGRYSPKKLDA
jgi:hypothetical protein